MGCFGVQCSVMPIRGEELEPVVSRVWCLSDSEFVLKSWKERKSAPIFFFFFSAVPTVRLMIDVQRTDLSIAEYILINSAWGRLNFLN